MLHGSQSLKQVHDVQRRLVELHSRTTYFRGISDGAGALSVMIGTSAPFSSLKPNSSGRGVIEGHTM